MTLTSIAPHAPSVDQTAPPESLSKTKSHAGTYALLDAGRGLACLWVVGHHALGFMPSGNLAPFKSFIYAFLLNGGLGVWIFFVISGYCIANTAASTLVSGRRGWAYSRARRIFPAYWCSAVICAATALLAQYAVYRGILRSSNLASINLLHQTPLFYFANLTLTQEPFAQSMLSGVFWTLSYEVGFYAIVAMALMGARYLSWSVRSMLNLLHLLTLATLAITLIAPAHIRYPLDLWPHFGLGVVVYDVLSNGWRRATIATAILAVCGIAAFVVGHPGRINYVDRGGSVAMLTSVACAIVLLSLYRFDARLSRLHVVRALAWVGLFSYSLYLTHVTIIGCINKAFEAIHTFDRVIPVYLLTVFVTSIVFARAFFQICERPFMSKRSRSRVDPVLEATQ